MEKKKKKKKKKKKDCSSCDSDIGVPADIIRACAV
jgi:hypothetical protein